MQQPAIFKGTEHCLLFVMGIKFMHPGLHLLIVPHGLLYGQVIRVRLSCTHTLSSFPCIIGKWKASGASPQADVIHSNTYTHTHSHTHWFIQCFSCYCGSKKAVPVCPQAICQRLHTALHSSLGKCPFAMEREHETCCQE